MVLDNSIQVNFLLRKILYDSFGRARRVHRERHQEFSCCARCLVGLGDKDLLYLVLDIKPDKIEGGCWSDIR